MTASVPPNGITGSEHRKHTDESLYLERERADDALSDRSQPSVGRVSDQVVNLARGHTDEVLAAARAQIDRQWPEPSPGTASRDIIRSERAREDQALREERARADQTIRAERAEYVGLLSIDRQKTVRTLAEDLAAIDETADSTITRARERADEMLAAARAMTDRESRRTAPGAPSHQTVERSWALEDQALQKERVDADEVLRAERAEHVSFQAEREETDKRLASERAQSVGALVRRDEMMNFASHDLRNMLSAMVGFGALVAKRVSGQPDLEAVLMDAQRIQRAGARMNRLIGDLVDVGSIEAGKLALTLGVGDATTVVKEAMETFQAQASACSVSLEAHIESPLSLAAFDPSRILQVLVNLLSNAIKFTPVGGRVLVHVERIGDEIRFAVSDTGVGIPADHLAAVFERYVQVSKNDRRGVGLGLYISKCIVQGHGGRLWAESRIGEGSTFCFTVPIHAVDQPLNIV